MMANADKVAAEANAAAIAEDVGIVQGASADALGIGAGAAETLADVTNDLCDMGALTGTRTSRSGKIKVHVASKSTVALYVVLGVLAAMLSGMFMAWIIAIGHIRYKADNCAIGMGVNLLAVALTKYLLNAILGQQGSFSDPKIIGIPKVHIPFLKNIPVLNDIFNDWSITEWFVIILVIAVWFVFYKTVWGLRLRAVGKFEQAAQTAGINVNGMKYQAILIAGLIGGLAGAHLSLGYSNLFRESMTNNRGFMGVAAMYFGNANPIFTAIGCLIFGFADSVGARVQAYGVPSQIVLLMPYVITIVVLVISLVSKQAAEKKKKSSLTGVSQ